MRWMFRGQRALVAAVVTLQTSWLLAGEPGGASDLVRDAGNAGRFAALQVDDEVAVPAAPTFRGPAAAPAVNQPAPATATERSRLQEREDIIRVITERLRQQVNSAVQEARKNPEPSLAIDDLKSVLGTVRSSIDVNATDRAGLERLLQNELAAMNNRKEIVERENVRVRERLSQREAQRRIEEQTLLEEERLTNLVERVRALMEEGRHGDENAYGEAEAVAKVALDIAPGNGTVVSARFNAEAAQQLARSYELVERRRDQFLETLHQVELSHVPIPDEPPVRFPPPEVWQALTERRRKWRSVDLQKSSKSVQKIQTELGKPTRVDFTDTPLVDAIEFLEGQHQIEIEIDKKQLETDGIPIDQPITLSLSGVSLRSVLKLMLDPEGLTYILENEVMRITSSTAADEKYSTRVYPVADLVVPPLPFGGGGQGGGGGLGGGGLGGGLGGGGQGGGGGGFGGGGQGGGGGVFNIPPKAAQKK